jgi:hypothetical protein
VAVKAGFEPEVRFQLFQRLRELLRRVNSV